MRRLAAHIYGREFSDARLVAYVVAYGMLALSFILPIHYACAEGSPCLGCGFREGLSLLVSFDLSAAFAASPLVLPALTVTALALADVFAIAWVRLRREAVRRLRPRRNSDTDSQQSKCSATNIEQL
jgi:hypothetical protein